MIYRLLISSARTMNDALTDGFGEHLRPPLSDAGASSAAVVTGNNFCPRGPKFTGRPDASAASSRFQPDLHRRTVLPAPFAPSRDFLHELTCASQPNAGESIAPACRCRAPRATDRRAE